MFPLTGLRRVPILVVPDRADVGRDGDDHGPRRGACRPGQKLQSASPQPGMAGAAVSPQQPRLAVVTLPDEIDIGNDGHVQDTLTSALDDGTAVLVADAGGTTSAGARG